jgi:2-amino-4-hydroxy-6-hydroxymethyldihydropteridine diphosphokinase
LAQHYLIALGSNQRHHRHGPPEQVLGAALEALGEAGIKLKRAGPVLRSMPLGPSRRRYANSAAMVKTKLEPEELLAALKAIERAFGRKRGGQHWGSRVLDLDIVLWSGGAWASPGLTIPHPRFRTRQFVLGPAASIAPTWRDPLSGLTLRQLAYRLAASASRPGLTST